MKIYWSIQDKNAWECALKVGYLEGNRNYICLDEFKDSYNWMIEQMKKRLKNYNGEQPVWLWLEKPDMRRVGHAENGTEIVRLTIEIPEEDVLVSDFELWHTVLNNSFNADDEKEWNAFYNNELDITIEESWERIFELDRPIDEEWSGKIEYATYQGTTGRISIGCIKKVEHFVAI